MTDSATIAVINKRFSSERRGRRPLLNDVPFFAVCSTSTAHPKEWFTKAKEFATNLALLYTSKGVAERLCGYS